MNIYSIVGLILDIIGVLILFKYGLPSEISYGDVQIFEETNEEERIRLKGNKIIERMSRIGLSFIIIGFVFQAIGCLTPSANINPEIIRHPENNHYSYCCYCQENCVCGCKDR